MKTIQFTIKPLGPFATPIQGDTLFGQMCWKIVRIEGEAQLTQLLSTYAHQPFAVVSDAFPAGYIPRPCLPAIFLGSAAQDPKERKEFKRKQWIPIEIAHHSLDTWMASAKTDQEVLSAAQSAQKNLQQSQPRMHNNINRLTGTTGEGFAPYAVNELWFAANISWHIYVVIHEQLITMEKIHQYLQSIGELGYGKNASIGAGRFVIESFKVINFPQHDKTNSVLALANVAPQGLPLDERGCFYQPFTRYGRHGDWAVLVNPFKAPILMAKTGAVLMPKDPITEPYFGQALGGNGKISATISETVHQGYAPVLPIQLAIKE